LLEISVDAIRIAVDESYHGLSLGCIRALCEQKVGDESVDRRPDFCSLEIERGNVTRCYGLLVLGSGRLELLTCIVEFLDCNSRPWRKFRASLELALQHRFLSEASGHRSLRVC